MKLTVKALKYWAGAAIQYKTEVPTLAATASVLRNFVNSEIAVKRGSVLSRST